jgi:hypothetical protein
MHGSQIELKDCDVALVPELTGAAATKVAAFHSAFEAKCGSRLANDEFKGIFTGTFVRRKALLFGWTKAMITPIFVIRDLDTKELDTPIAACPS